MHLLSKFPATLKIWLRILMPTCRQAIRLQSEALDHSLSVPQRFGLRLHLLLCRWCRRYGHQLRFLRTAARQVEAQPPSGESHRLSASARERLKRALNDPSQGDV